MKRLARAAALFALVSIFLAPARTLSQAGPGQEPSASSPSGSEASNQSSSQDDNAQFMHSPSVHLLARITGLSDEGAFWLAVAINFAIVVGLIWWLWSKNVPALFRARTAGIQKAIEEARRASEDANRRLAEVEKRLGRLDQEIGEMRAISEKEAAAEEERIKSAAAEDARRIVESAEQEIAASAKAARRELTAYAADLAISLAEKQIHVDTPADQRLVRRFAQQLTNGSSSERS